MNISNQVSAIVMTKNEVNNIAKCLASLGSIGEIFVVDSSSTDGTQQLAADCGAKVVPFEWNGQYPKKKQWALENLPFANDWVLYVDADEECTPELLAEIGEVISSDSHHAGYFVGYDYVFMGKVLKYGQKVFKLVLFNRHQGRFNPVDDLDATNMWEVEGHYQPEIDGTVGTLHHTMIHADHDSLYHYFERHNRYSDWEALVREQQSMTDTNESTTGMRRVMKRAFDAMPLKAPAAFVYSYGVGRGFLDGKAGFHYALAKAFYYWQIDLKRIEARRRGGRHGEG